MDQQMDKLEPYVGPRPFQREEGEFFFGRRLEVNDLISLITAYPVVLLYAQSGAGKTSLLKASLLPQLEEEEDFRVLEPARVRMQGTLEVSPADIKNIFVFNALTSWNAEKLSQAELAKMSLQDFLKRHRIASGEQRSTPLVIVFDQFEELFTHHLDRWEDREDFFAQVTEALEADSDLRVYFVMREDYIAELDPYAQILPGKLRTRFRMERLRRENALDAIKGPLAAPSVKDEGRHFADGVAEALVDDLLKVRVQTSAGEKEVPGQFVEPVQLQVVCKTLWHELKPEDKIITFDHLKSFGDVNEALTKFFNATIKQASKESGVSEGALRRWFDRVLITREGNRGTVQRGEHETAGLPNTAIAVFEAERLLRTEPRDGRLWYELSQDRLIRPIQNSYKKWLAEQPGDEQTRLRLEDQAMSWSRNRDQSLLLDQGQLLIAKRWIEEEATGGYTEALYSLVKASEAKFVTAERERERQLTEEQKLRAEAETERAAALELTAREQQLRADEKVKSYRRLRYLAAGLAVLLLLSVASTAFAFYQRGEAQRNAALAKIQQEKAQANEMDATQRRKEAEAEKQKAIVAREAEGRAKGEALEAKAKAEKAAQAEKDLKQKAVKAREEAVAATAEAVKQRALADQLRLEAENKKDISRSQALAANALLQLNTDPELGLLLAIKAADVPNPPKEARDALLKALEASHLRSVIETKDNAAMLASVFSPDGKTVLTSGEDGKVQKWNALEERSPRQGTNIVHDRDARIFVVAFSQDNKRLATAGNDRTVRFWNLEERTNPITIERLELSVRKIAVSRDGTYALVSDGNDVLVYDLRTKKLAAFLRPQEQGGTRALESASNNKVNSLEFAPDGGLAAVAQGDKVRLWDIGPEHRAKWEGPGPVVEDSIRPLVGHVGQVNSARFSPDGKLIVTASDDRTARLWDIDGKLIYQFVGHESEVDDASFSPDSKFIVTAGRDWTGRVWDTETGQRVAVLRGHKAAVISANFSPDGNYVVTTSKDKTTRVWQLDLNQKMRVLTGHKAELSDVAVSPNGQLIATSSYDKTISIWDVASGRRTELPAQGSPIDHVAFSPDGKRLVISDYYGEGRVWDIESGQIISKVNEAGVLSQDGKLLARPGFGYITIYDTITGNPVSTLEPLDPSRISRIWPGARLTISFSPDNRFIAAADLTGYSVLVWNIESKAKSLVLTLPRSLIDVPNIPDVITGLEFSPNGKSLLVARSGGSAYFWAISGSASFSLSHSWHGASARGATYSRDGNYVCIWGERTASISDARPVATASGVTAGVTVSVMNGHSDDITRASFSPDGRLLVTASKDKTARVWDVASGDELAELRGHTALVSAALFSPDGRFVITSSYDKTARIFDCPECGSIADILSQAKRRAPEIKGETFSTGETASCAECGDLPARVAEACARVTRNQLTPDEKARFSIGGSEEQPRVCIR